MDLALGMRSMNPFQRPARMLRFGRVAADVNILLTKACSFISDVGVWKCWAPMDIRTVLSECDHPNRDTIVWGLRFTAPIQSSLCKPLHAASLVQLQAVGMCGSPGFRPKECM